MSRLRWPDSTNSVSDVPGTIQCGKPVRQGIVRPGVKTSDRSLTSASRVRASTVAVPENHLDFRPYAHSNR